MNEEYWDVYLPDGDGWKFYRRDWYFGCIQTIKSKGLVIDGVVHQPNNILVQQINIGYTPVIEVKEI